jgi:hypothetical protein
VRNDLKIEKTWSKKWLFTNKKVKKARPESCTPTLFQISPLFPRKSNN